MALKDLFDHLSEQTAEKLQKEFADYLMPGETVGMGFKLVRDALLITDKRIVILDKQGATGVKVKVESIFLQSIVGVTLETAGFGMDENELELTYIASPFYRSNHPLLTVKKFEFQKKVNIQSLYVKLEEIAYGNCLKINQD